MKIRRLPDIDLARIAPLPRDQQRRQLEQIRSGRPPLTYNPLRVNFHDIFNVQPDMFGPVQPTAWAIVEAQLQRKCRSKEELDANLAVALGLHQFVIEAKLLGRAQEFFSLVMGGGRAVSYWLPMVLAYEGRPLVPFIDPRRTHGLTRVGRRFAFSMMHERIRAVDPDYGAVRFAIFRFGDLIEDRRNPILYLDDGVPRFSLDELEAMVGVTYALWHEVCEERGAEERRKGTGTAGPLI